jgi:hypothetical protein
MIVLSHGDKCNNGTVQYNFNVVRFIAVTPPMAALRFLCIISAMLNLCPNHLFWPSLFLDRAESFPLFSASSIKHQVASVILHVRTGLAPLRRLASGLSPVNKTTTATAVVMTATATRLRIVQPLLKCSKICGNGKKLRLSAPRKTTSCTISYLPAKHRTH